jgi:hypothetical protein
MYLLLEPQDNIIFFQNKGKSIWQTPEKELKFHIKIILRKRKKIW